MGRVDAGVEGALEFAAADDVGAGAALGHQAEDGEVVVGLDGVVDADGQAGEGGLEVAEAGSEGAGGDDPGGGADGVGDGIEGDVFDQEAVHGVQGEVRPGGDQLGGRGVFAGGQGGGAHREG